jgi:hypothetical protein
MNLLCGGSIWKKVTRSARSRGGCESASRRSAQHSHRGHFTPPTCPKRMAPVIAPSTRQALRAFAAALGVPKTARRFKTTPKTLHALLGDDVIPRGTRHKVDDTLVRAAYDQGLPIAVIAARFECSDRTIRNSLQHTEPIGTELRPV